MTYEKQSVCIAEHLTDHFRTLGRTYVKSNRLYLDFASTGIHFVADCEGDVSVRIFVANNSHANSNYFTVYIDGKRTDTRLFVNKETSGEDFVMAKDLPRGRHEFRLINQTQFIWTQASLDSLTLCGSLLEKPAPRDLFLEFYGDSILNGANLFMGGTSIHTTDSTQSFAFQTAEALNADMSVVGCSAIGLTCNNRNFIMKDLLLHCGAQYSSGADKNGVLLMEDIPLYDFARIPNAAIVALGTNDGKNAEKEIFQTELSYLVSHLRTKYGEQMPIVFPIGYTNGPYNTAIPAILDRLGGENAKLYACKLSFASAAKEIGGDGIHPNLETAAVMAQELTAFLKSLLNP